jgi:Flp pilus assembly pilin Flp
MNTFGLAVLLRIRDLLARNEGQDLVEYSMVFAMIALGTAASMQAVATAVVNVFVTVDVFLVTNI